MAPRRGRSGKRPVTPSVNGEEPVTKQMKGSSDEVIDDPPPPSSRSRARKAQVKSEPSVDDAADIGTQNGKTMNGGEAKKTAPAKRGRKKAGAVKQEDGQTEADKPTTSSASSVAKVAEVKTEDKKDLKGKSPAPPQPSRAKTKAKSTNENKTTKPKASGASKSKAKKGKADDDNEEEEETTGGQSKSKKASKGKKKNDSSNDPPKSVQKSGADRVVMVKGRAAVDGLCPIAANSHVYEEDDDIWDCMLNQTNIQWNNNKYYLIQLLKDDNAPVYSVWMRWGRVGANGQNSLQPCGSDLDKAKKIFEKKFKDKTKNDWDMRDMFEKVPGKYDLLSMDYSKNEDTTDAASTIEKANQERKKIESQLDARIRQVIEMICNIKAMEECVVEMKYDAKKAPLGKLTKEQVKAGYLALKKISELVESPKYNNNDLVQACNDFYTRIPHYFGMKVPPLIRTNDEIQEKLRLLDSLADIQAALSVLNQPVDKNLHPVDQKYQNLKCDLKAVERDHPDFKVIERYLKTTHAKTHSAYTLELLELFSCHKESEHDRFQDVGNRVLLWHGSRLSNMAGILSTGLRIAPKEAPVTGYMFGKGIYFADMSSKSANYCWATRTNDVGFMLLSEVALGKCNELLHADYNANELPAGCNSVKGCGQTGPLIKNYTKLSDGTVVPMGPGTKVSCKGHSGYSLLYNEYIVYDPAQVLTRFLLKVKFNFN